MNFNLCCLCKFYSAMSSIKAMHIYLAFALVELAPVKRNKCSIGSNKSDIGIKKNINRKDATSIKNHGSLLG